MAESYNTFNNIEDVGSIHVSNHVVSVIAGIAATEVEGVASLVGNITNEIITTLGIKNISKGISVEMEEEKVSITVTLNILFGFSVPTVSRQVQDRVSSAVETMTGLSVSGVHVIVSDIRIKK